MTTGDISNNIRKMRSRLKEIKYSDTFDVNLLAEGQPAAYLPIYHYAFTNYSQPLAQLILDKGIELFGKSDARFMEAVYKILRDVFVYKPPITKEQFFAKGFAERKVIMCADILQLVKQKHKELKPAPPKTAMKTSVRPKSAAETKALPLVPKTKLETRRPEPVRHLSSAISHPHPVRHVARRESTESSASSDHSDSVPRPILSVHNGTAKLMNKHVSIQSPREVNHISPRQGSLPQGLPQGGPQWQFEDTPEDLDDVKSHFMTPSVKKVCTRSIEMVTMPQGDYDDLDRDTSIVEIQARTRDSLLQSPVSTSNLDITSLYQTVEALSSQVMMIARNQQAGGNVATDGKLDEAVSKIENLTARLLLLENRMSIIEAKMDTIQVSTNSVNSHSTSNHVTLVNNQSNMRPSHAKPTGNQSSPEKQPSKQSFPARQPTNQSKPDYPLKENSYLQPEVKPVSQDILQSDMLNEKYVFTRDRGQGDNKMDQSNIDQTGLFSGPGNSFAEELRAMGVSQKGQIKETTDFSLNYSPIRRVNNGIVGSTMSANEDTFALETEDDARRASTPTFGGTFYGENSLQCDISHVEIKDTVSRIHNMMKETTKMMKEQAVVHPVQRGAEQPDVVQPPEVDSIN
ncbi:uncharacterized protein LOC132755267 isoform X2 [Ruditapes philippinarum]|uniref:uncharacterized protein LOC132755267 isoform X2 n=1 Tax=Ruditapes philippinarum TaxID=129788 RepID=UPI00295AE651|nr:uncharacterized protein LOC132755267 isoform X2 [Ruditapes philippinarum]